MPKAFPVREDSNFLILLSQNWDRFLSLAAEKQPESLVVGFRTQTLASLEARIRDSQLRGTIRVSHRVPSGSTSGASSEPRHACDTQCLWHSPREVTATLRSYSPALHTSASKSQPEKILRPPWEPLCDLSIRKKNESPCYHHSRLSFGDTMCVLTCWR